MAIKGVRCYLIKKDGKMKSFWPGWMGPKIVDGWVTLKGSSSSGKYHVDPSAYVIREYVSRLYPLDPRPLEEWAIFFHEGNPEPMSMTGAAPSPGRTSDLIAEAMDGTWIRQALRKPGWDIITIAFFVSIIANIALGAGLVSLALR